MLKCMSFEALKVFKIIYEKSCEKGVKGFDLKKFSKVV
jgi:hypothetical protein